MRRMTRRLFQNVYPIVIGVLLLLVLYFGGFYSWSVNMKEESFVNNVQHREKMMSQNHKIERLMSILRRYQIPEEEYLDHLLPIIYIITPTYDRPHQKAELTRLMNVFSLVPSIHWIVIEDSKFKTQKVSNFLKKSGLPHTHLFIATPEKWKLKNNDPNWYKPRGVLQRNEGIRWLRDTFRVKSASGIVYFADDDNTYSTDLFDEMRWTKKVSVWPVGLVGGAMVERPKISNGRVVGWLAPWRPDRPFALDMAAFAVNLELLLTSLTVSFSLDSDRGFIETDFLQKLVKLKDLEPKAGLCTKVFVWHTRTEKPFLKEELLLIKEGKSTDEAIEV